MIEEIHWQSVILDAQMVYRNPLTPITVPEAAAVTADGDPVARSTATSGAEAFYPANEST